MTAPQLRIDRSKAFSTVHGERATDDPHSGCHFFQDGLPFDAEGVLIPRLVNEKLRPEVERRLKKLASIKARDADANAGEGEGEVDVSPPDQTGSDVNLEGWLRGDAYHWSSVQKAIAARFSQRIGKMADAVTFLVEDEKIIPESEVSPRLLALLSPRQ